MGAILRLYAALLRLYPREFRLEFGEEMRAVFASALRGAAPGGVRELAGACLRELRDLPGRVLVEHWIAFCEKRGVKKMRPNGALTVIDAAPREPAPWGEVLLGAAPFLAVIAFQALAFAASNLRAAWLGIPVIALGVLFLLGGVGLLVLAFSRGFPRWSMPYAAWFVLVLLILPMFRISATMMMPGIVVAAILGLAAAGVALTRSWGRLAELFGSIRRDPSLISFGLYSLLAVAPVFMMDEVDHAFVLPFAVAANAVLAVGAVVYLRARRGWVGALGLLLDGALAIFLPALANTYYWAATGRGSGDYVGAAVTSLVVLAILFAPAALMLLKRSRA